MKKIAKLSLVAAVAVAGMTTASAASLEESIKGVDISGMVRYRFTETNTEKSKEGSKQENDYDIEVNAKIPVNDMLKAIIKIDVDGDLEAKNRKVYDKNGNLVNKNEPSDSKPSVNIEDAYFSYTNQGFVVNAGKQNVPGPLTDALNGTGIVAMAPVGPVTLAAGYFNGTAAGYNNIAAVAAIASFDMVNVSAWYADHIDEASAYSVAADAKLGPVALDVRYSEKELDNETATTDDLSVLKIGAEAEFGMFTVNAGFAMTGKDNGNTGGVALDGEADAVVNDFQLEQKDVASDFSDAKAFKVGASVNATDAISLGADYLFADYANDSEYSEIVGTVGYKMSKNFKIKTFYSHAENEVNKGDKVKTNKGRIELKYTF